MKNIFIVLVAIVVTGMAASCQGLKVPVAVKNAFTAKFPGATNVKWGKENAKEFEADFKLNNVTMSSNFGMDGSWVETETVIPVTDVPAVVSNAIKAKYPGTIISKAEKLEKPGGKVIYEAVVKIKGKSKELEVNADGSFVK
ncbi:MAG TPA: PepSY-like domain-containing protein [Chitinophagaceae bacterium]|nr:PepSY-like domain-containing protein [Chitinophagaceae bacterium]